ncbi:hypothetical protein A2U01_0055768, partial [Trifolium medium]|nr:hypothetical protein [Trifolium medium]
MDTEVIESSKIHVDISLSSTNIPTSETQDIVISDHIELNDQNNAEIITNPNSEPNIPSIPKFSNPELVKLCNNIIKRVKEIHSLRYSFVEPNEYLTAWEKLKSDIIKDLELVQAGDMEDLVDYQENLKDWVKSVKSE